jgi:tetratricopeptide (TPR) repeat protein
MPLDELPDLLAYLVRFRWWQTLGAATTLVVVVMAALLAVRAMVRAGRARRSIRRSVSNPVLAGAGMDRRAKHWFAFSKKVVKTAVLAFCGWASWVQCNDIRNGWLLHRMQATLDAIDLDLARLRAHTEDPPSEARLRISLGTEGRTASKDTFDTDWADAHAYAYYGQLIKDVDRLDRSVHAPRLLDEIEVTTGEFRAIRGRERDAYLRAGDFLLDSDQTDKAKDLYLRCLAIEPENRHAWEKLADCEVDLGHPERAVDALTKLLSTPAMRDAPSAARARTLHRRGSARLLLATDSKKLRATIDDLDAAILAMMRPPVADDAAAPAEELVRCLLDRGLASYFLGDARRAVADCHRAVALTAQLGADSGTKTQVLRSLSRGYRGIVSSVPDFDREAALADLNDAIVRLGSQQSGGDPRLERDYAIFLIARGEMLLVGMDRATEADRSFAAGIAATTDPSTRRFSGDSVHMGYLARAYQGGSSRPSRRATRPSSSMTGCI